MNAPCAKENSGSYPVARLLKRVLQLFRENVDDALRPHGLTSAQLHVLATLECEPGISGASLARTCHVTPQSTQVLLRGIEANGWIARVRHPENNRILLATLTPAGKQILARSRACLEQVNDQMLGGFYASETSTLEALLVRCASNLELRPADACAELAAEKPMKS